MTLDGIDLAPVDPSVAPEVQRHWDALGEGRIELPRCDACGVVIWYPRLHCPACGAGDVTWVEVSGAGTVYTYTVVHRAPGPFAGAVPYVLAYVELDAGPRLLANLVEVAPDDVTVGMAVRPVIAATAGGPVLRFAPAGAPGPAGGGS